MTNFGIVYADDVSFFITAGSTNDNLRVSLFKTATVKFYNRKRICDNLNLTLDDQKI